MSDETKLDCLPAKIMGDIFDYLDSVERQRLRRVSAFWNRNIMNRYGTKLAVKNANLEMMLGCSDTQIIAHFQDFTLPMPMTESGMHFMKRLTSLSLTEMVVCYNIIPVFENCLHIRKLEFVKFYLNPYLKHYEVSVEDPFKLLPELRALTIKGGSRFEAAEYKFLKTLLPFFKPLNSDIGKLDTIVLESAGRCGPLEITLNKIFGKDCLVVKDPCKFKSYPFPPIEPIDREIAEQFYLEVIQANRNTLRYLELGDGTFGTGIKIAMKTECKSTELQITNFEQTLMFGNRPNYLRHGSRYICMSPFLSAQTQLKTLSVLLSDTMTLEQVCTIANGNATTLTSLSIRYAGEERLNASSISQLNNLHTLRLQPIFCFQCQISAMFFETRVQVININHLPTSLRVLIVFGSLEFSNVEDFNEAFFNNLRNLEILKILAMPFYLFPNKKTYVMESLDIRRLIAWLPKLKELVLRNCRPRVEFIDNPNPTWTTNTVDALPDCSTDWISTKNFISFQKIPFIDLDLGIPDENSRLYKTGPHDEWDPEDPPAVYGFPVYFDGVILIEPQFRGKYGISD